MMASLGRSSILQLHRSKLARVLIVVAGAVSLSGCEWLFPDDYEGNCPEKYRDPKDVRDAIVRFIEVDSQRRRNLFAFAQPDTEGLETIKAGCRNCAIFLHNDSSGQDAWVILWVAHRSRTPAEDRPGARLILKCSGWLQYDGPV